MNQKDVIILAIETSCDDTSVAVVKNGSEVLSNVVWNQNKTHERFGGIVPELGARRHLKVINYVIDEAISKSGLDYKDLDAIAVNNQKGLIRSLVVGVAAAKALAFSLNIPLISVHHIEGHIYSNILSHSDLNFPHLCLTISGGHNLLVLINNHFDYQIIGNTLDDACGEVFDKVARILNLGFPGGPIIDKLAKEGDSKKYRFSRPMLDQDNFNFSFSGLKTEMTRFMSKNENNSELKIADVAASFQQAVVDTLIGKTIKASKKFNLNQVSVVGGVSANSKLRSDFNLYAHKLGFKVYFPELSYTTDNAAMIGAVAFYKYLNGQFEDLSLEVFPNRPL
jgi:N6-L-threonylcarbamoyladenine synthase